MRQKSYRLRPVKRTEHFDWTTLNICSAKLNVIYWRSVAGWSNALNILLNKAELSFTYCARANWTNIQWLVKRTEQHSTFRKTKEMLSCSTFVQWKVWSRSNVTEQNSTRVSKAQQGGQTLWTFCTQQMFSVVQGNVQYVWPGPNICHRLATRVLVVAPMTFMMTQQRTRTICNPKFNAIFTRLEKI